MRTPNHSFVTKQTQLIDRLCALLCHLGSEQCSFIRRLLVRDQIVYPYIQMVAAMQPLYLLYEVSIGDHLTLITLKFKF